MNPNHSTLIVDSNSNPLHACLLLIFCPTVSIDGKLSFYCPYKTENILPAPDRPGMTFHIDHALKNMVKCSIIFDSPRARHDRGEWQKTTDLIAIQDVTSSPFSTAIEPESTSCIVKAIPWTRTDNYRMENKGSCLDNNDRVLAIPKQARHIFVGIQSFSHTVSSIR